MLVKVLLTRHLNCYLNYRFNYIRTIQVRLPKLQLSFWSITHSHKFFHAMCKIYTDAFEQTIALLKVNVKSQNINRFAEAKLLLMQTFAHPTHPCPEC